MLQTLEKKIAEWKLQIGEYKRQMLALKKTSEQKKAYLRRAIRSQKQKTECFEEAVENLTSRVKERVSDYTDQCCPALNWMNNWETFTFVK